MTQPAHIGTAPGPVFLIGFMGVGKSTVGKILAQRMGRPFIDVDQVVEQGIGQTIRQIFEERGEAGFRLLEAAGIEEAARSEAVVAVGGGAPAYGHNLETMHGSGVVVLLSADTETLLSRLQTPDDGQHTRPLLAGTSRGPLLAEVVANLYARRASAYAQADLVVETGGLTPEQVADQVLSALGSLSSQAAGASG